MLTTEPTDQRPKRLTILLVLTLINTGSSIFFGLLTVLFFKPTAADLKKERLEMAKSIVELKELGLDSLVEMLEKVQSMTEVLNAHFISSNLVNIAIAMLGAAAAYLMFKRNHLGFHGYIIYNLLACVSVYFFYKLVYCRNCTFLFPSGCQSTAIFTVPNFSNSFANFVISKLASVLTHSCFVCEVVR